MVQCDACHVWFHLSCLGFSDAEELGDEWYCFRCSGGLRPKARPRPPTHSLPPTPTPTSAFAYRRGPTTPRIDTEYRPVTPPQVYTKDPFYDQTPSASVQGLRRSSAALKMVGGVPVINEPYGKPPTVSNPMWTPGRPTIEEYRAMEGEAIAHWNANETPSRGAGVRGLPWTPPMTGTQKMGWWAEPGLYTPGAGSVMATPTMMMHHSSPSKRNLVNNRALGSPVGGGRASGRAGERMQRLMAGHGGERGLGIEGI
ncbi:hypothetical protein BT69DRAFT_288604 [Atractiella rhizophila]|nr:hypothetical protein BT69DRAFT_288604 [Atractiella rhizophila]